MENPTKARKATLRMMITIAATSMVENRFAIGQFWRQSSGSVDLDHVRGNGSISRSGTCAISIPANRPRRPPLPLAISRRRGRRGMSGRDGLIEPERHHYALRYFGRVFEAGFFDP
jgi:hypothetical protein